MDFSDRLGWLLAGMLIGYILRLIQEIRRDGLEVKNLLKKKEEGFMRYPLVADIALILVILMCVFASFSTQWTNNKLEQAMKEIEAGQKIDSETQRRLSLVTHCTQDYLAQTIEALNERTVFTQKQANSNVELQEAQSDFFGAMLSTPPLPDADLDRAIDTYVEKLNNFIDVASKQKDKTNNFPYPTEKQLNRCLNSDSTVE